MAADAQSRSDFLESYVAYTSIRHALDKNLFRKDSAMEKAAQKTLKNMESTRSIFGRQLRVLKMVEKGATIEDMQKAAKSSRRTMFRYLNYLEAAGVEIALEKGVYTLEGNPMG